MTASPSSPAAASSGSRPGPRLQAAARAAGARAPVDLHGRVPELAAEPAVAAEQLAAEDDPAADADLARGVDEVAVARGGALPQLRQRREVGLVVGVQRQLRRVDALAQLVDHRNVGPVQVGRDEQRAALEVDEPGQRDGRADRAQTLGLDLVQRALRQRAERVQHLVDAAAAVVDRLHRLVARAAGEVGGLHAEVVDVDLEPERDHAVARDVDDEPRPPGRPAVLGAALDQQPELHQLADEAGDRALVEAGLLRDRRSRARPELHDLAQHDAQVVAPDGALTRQLDRRFGGPHR